MHRARSNAAEAAHAQAAVRSRDADLRDLEAQLSSLMIPKHSGGGGGGGGIGRGGHARLHTASALPNQPRPTSMPVAPKGGNDLEQGYVDWVGRLSPRAALGGWLSRDDHDTSSVPLPPPMPERCDLAVTYP